MDLQNFVVKEYENFLSQGDPRVEELPLMKTPTTVIIILAAYLGFVNLGPKFMRHREAYSLGMCLKVYNVFQVILSSYMCIEFAVTVVKSNYDMSCATVDYGNNVMALRMVKICWVFFFSKIIDLLDTVFFVLRKKNNQITFLHVYHHFTMIINWWLGVKFAPGGQAWAIGALNSFIHVVMYSYYFLSCLGDAYRKYLWWKRYLTQAQLIQFVMLVYHSAGALWIECSYPRWLSVMSCGYLVTLMVLFSNFYVQAYKKKKGKVMLNVSDKLE